MNLQVLAYRNIKKHYGTSWFLVLAAALSCAIISGALYIGDSVQHSLHLRNQQKLGQVQYALTPPERHFRESLLAPSADISPILTLMASLSQPGMDRPALPVICHGIDQRFKTTTGFDIPTLQTNEAAISSHLALRYQLKLGDTILVRVEKSSWLPRDAAITSLEDRTTAMRLQIKAILSADQGSEFNLGVDPRSPLSVFIALQKLQEQADLQGRANVLLSSSQHEPALQQQLNFEDLGLQSRKIKDQYFEIKSKRVFISPEIEKAALTLDPNSQTILSYFVNAIYTDQHLTPYSMASSINLDPEIPQLKPGEIAINTWQAKDAQLKIGDQVSIRYYVPAGEDRLDERIESFKVKHILEIQGRAADAGLIPDFPGITDAGHCREWDQGLAIDLNLIREEDEAYWEKYKGTPKVFISQTDAKRIWENRWGRFTGLRIQSSVESVQDFETEVLKHIHPSQMGFKWQAVQARAEKGLKEGMSFSGLFLAFSLFLTLASLALSFLFSGLFIQARIKEIGTLKSLGWPKSMIHGLISKEILPLCGLGALLGAGLGLIYTQACLWGLQTLWQDAIKGTPISFSPKVSSFFSAFIAIYLVQILISRWVLSKTLKKAGLSLIKPTPPLVQSIKTQNPFFKVIPWILIGLAIALSFYGWQSDPQLRSAIFFGVSILVLISGLILTTQKWRRPKSSALRNIKGLGWRNASRNPWRSLAISFSLALGVFMIASLGAHRLDAYKQGYSKHSGVGGYKLFMETALPLHGQFDSEEYEEEYNLNTRELPHFEWVPLRLKAGDDTSCLNLQRAQTPTLLGVPTATFAQEGLFFPKEKKDSWLKLQESSNPEKIVPAIVDETTLLYSLGLTPGSSLEFINEFGEVFELRFVSTLKNSMFQGAILIDESLLLQHFPSISGYQRFLIDLPESLIPSFQKHLQQSFQREGAYVRPTLDILNEYMSVQNSYISIFESLGALGVLLGLGALGVLTLKQATERLSEWSLFKTLGFSDAQLEKVIQKEQEQLMRSGLFWGWLAALVALSPSFLEGQFPSPIWLVSSFTIMWAVGHGSVKIAAWIAKKQIIERRISFLREA